MPSRTVSLEQSAHQRLKAAKKAHESFSGLVFRLLPDRRHSLTELAGALSPRDAAGIRRVLQEARRAEAISEWGPLRSRSRSRERHA
jgi:predicted CopG family antitoxin